jgi:hypothetical protein
MTAILTVPTPEIVATFDRRALEFCRDRMLHILRPGGAANASEREQARKALRAAQARLSTIALSASVRGRETPQERAQAAREFLHPERDDGAAERLASTRRYLGLSDGPADIAQHQRTADARQALGLDPSSAQEEQARRTWESAVSLYGEAEAAKRYKRPAGL